MTKRRDRDGETSGPATASPERRRRRRRHRILWTFLALLFVAALALGYPFLGLAGMALNDALHPVPKAPGPYSSLPAPTGPLEARRLVFDSNRSGTFEIFTMGPDGRDPRRLTDDPRYDSWWPRVSPDRNRILFYRASAGTHDRDATKNSLWVMNADGSNQLEIRPRGTDGWRLQAHAEWSPDGSQLVMFGGSRFNPQIYVTTSSGQRLRKLTARPGTNIDPSWSPDSRTVFFVGCPGTVCFEGDYEIYAVPSSGGDVTRLTNDDLRDQDPYPSPDGRRLAWLTETSTEGIGQWNIRIADADGSSPALVTSDRHINSKSMIGSVAIKRTTAITTSVSRLAAAEGRGMAARYGGASAAAPWMSADGTAVKALFERERLTTVFSFRSTFRLDYAARRGWSEAEGT